MERYACYANQIRQEIHRNPEIGYDLPPQRTAPVKEEPSYVQFLA